jgi:Tfp pilus assembly PilM family ATPase
LLAATAAKGGLKIDRALAWPEEQPPTVATAAAFGQRLKEHLKAAGIASAPLLVAIGRDRVILKEVRYPAVPPHEEPGVVRFQAVKELTDPADEVTIDYQAGDAPEPSGERKALAVAIRKDVLSAYRALAAAAGTKVVGVAPRAFGVIACLQRVANPAPDPGTAFAVLTVGEKGGEFAVARGDFLAFARPLAGPALASDAALLGEIRRNLAVYAGQSPQHPVRALYVAEGNGQSLGVGDRLRDTLAIPVFRFDPLAGEQAPAGATAGSFAGVAGLLHLYGRGKGLPINFIKPREPKPPADPNRRLLTWAGIAAGLLLLIGGVIGYVTVAAKQREVDRLGKQLKGLDDDLVMLDQDERRIAAVDQWQKSEIVWLEEIYNLTARWPDVAKLRLSELSAEPLQLPPSQPGRPIDASKPVAIVKLRGLSTDDGPLSTLMRELVKDAARVNAKQISPNTTGTSRRQFAQQWSTSYQLAHDTPNRKPFVAQAPDRGRNRNRGRGGPDVGDAVDFFLNGGVP